MIKAVIIFALFALAKAGHEAPPPQSYTYNVPNVAKVTYPGPTLTRSVETYSAPSIEKTTTITRTITAPINAPAVKQIAYSAPVAPVVAAVKHAVPVASAYGAPAVAVKTAAVAAPIAVAGAPVAYSGFGGPIAHSFGYAAPGATVGFGHGAPAVSSYNSPVHSQFATTYAAPSLGYQLGGVGGLSAFAGHVGAIGAAPVAAALVA